MGKQNKEGKGSNTNRPACAACKHQRRKCQEDCVLAPYFPTDKTQEYEAVHRVFGYSNIAKMLTNLDQQARKEAVKSFEWEAMMWKQDPVFGPLGAYNKACNIITQLLNFNLYHQTVPTSEPKLMALTQDSSPPFTNEALALSNNVNWAPLVANNVVQNPYVNSFGGVLQNEDPKILNCVPVPNALHPAPTLLHKSSILQPSYLQSLTSADVALSSAVDQPSQVKDFQYYNENKITEPDGNVENIYTDGQVQGSGISQRGTVAVGHGQQDHGEHSVIEGNIDHTMAQNRVLSQITGFQHPIYYPVGHAKIKQQDQHCYKQHQLNSGVEQTENE